MRYTIGLDAVFIPRFARRARDKTLAKLFLPGELQRKTHEHLAGLFAAKEAVMKALGIEPGRWLEIEITHSARGAPSIRLSPLLEKEKNVKACLVSITHDNEYALAIALCEIKKCLI